MSRNDGQGEDDRPVTTQDILKASTPPRHLLHRAATTVIYDALRIMLAQPKRRPHLRALVKYLVEHRAQTPNAFLYEALVASNWEPAGSAEEVRQILDEMRDLGVGTTSSLYHAALRALAVHPDYLLRNRIVAEMRERWLDLTPEGRCSVALGLLRDGQHELALDKLEAMLDAEDLPTVPSWVVDIFIVVLAQHTHLDEALSLLQRRTSSSSPPSPALSPNIWSLILDECSRNYHYAGTRLAWDALVPTKLLNPSDGTCLNVLNTAARHSDARLAADVVAHLSARSAKLGAHHHEALVDSYAHRDDVSNALQALCVMARSAATTSAATTPSHASTASLRAAFRRNPALARASRDALLRLGEADTVPLAAFNAVLDGLLLTLRDDEDMEDAFSLYRQVRHLCGCGPDGHTFAPFVERMTTTTTMTSDPEREREAARFLADEMRAFGLPPAARLYDRLVYLAATAGEGDLDAAFEVLGELEEQLEQKQQQHPASERGRGGWITAETALAVARACVSRRDERVWGLLRSARRVGVDLGPAGRALEEEGADWEVLDEEEVGRKGRGKEKRDEKAAQRQVPPWLGDALFREETAGRDVGSG